MDANSLSPHGGRLFAFFPVLCQLMEQDVPFFVFEKEIKSCYG